MNTQTGSVSTNRHTYSIQSTQSQTKIIQNKNKIKKCVFHLYTQIIFFIFSHFNNNLLLQSPCRVCCVFWTWTNRMSVITGVPLLVISLL